MNDPIFFASAAPITLAEIAALTGVQPASTDLARSFDGVAAIEAAGPRQVSCADRSGDRLATTRAGACFVVAVDRHRLAAATIALVCEDPPRVFAKLVGALHPDVAASRSLFATRGISPAAFIHSEARLEDDVTIDPGVVIGPRAEVGSGSIVGANSVIGPQVRIGRHCSIGAQVTVVNALVGNAVVIYPGARIGQDRAGALFAGLGRVIIQDGVEIGANTTIDRGGLGDTVLGEGCRIGNLTHIERDSVVGRHVVLNAGSGASGDGPTPSAGD